MKTIYFAGVVHGSFQHVIETVERDRPDALEANQPLEQVLAPILEKTAVRFIHGNHDTDTPAHYQHVFQCRLASCNLHGRVEVVAGIRIAGLGGVFRGRIWFPPAPPIFPSYAAYLQVLQQHRPQRERVLDKAATSAQERQHHSTIFFDVYQRLMSQKADILVTHEAPSCPPHGFTAIDELARAMGVKSDFHGHHHDRRNYSDHWETLGFRAYGVGYRGITALDGTVIVPGQYDRTA